MRIFSWLFVLAFCTSCSGSNTSSSHKREPWPTASPQPTARPLKIQAGTYGDLAAALEIHPDYILLAGNTCHHRTSRCDQEPPGYDKHSVCDVILALEWCKTVNCDVGFMVGQDDPCYREMRGRECDDLDRPFQCDSARKAQITLVPNAWPDEEPENPYETILR